MVDGKGSAITVLASCTARSLFLLFIVFIVLAVALFRRVFRGKGMCGHGGSSNALTTLSERFAKGEIEEEEFRAKRDVLKSRK